MSTRTHFPRSAGRIEVAEWHREVLVHHDLSAMARRYHHHPPRVADLHAVVPPRGRRLAARQIWRRRGVIERKISERKKPIGRRGLGKKFGGRATWVGPAGPW